VNRIDPRGLDDEGGAYGCGRWWGEGLGMIYGVGPMDANTASEVHDAAAALAQLYYPGTDNKDKNDAFRHCLASCDLAKKIGKDQAADVGDLHETFCPNSCKDRAQDLANNGIGRGFADNPNADCITSCRQAVESGDLYGVGP
jgi:hypothetical protein